MTLDGSECGEASIDLADPLLRLRGVRVELLFVMPCSRLFGLVPVDLTELHSEARETTLEEADRYVQETARRLRDAGVDARGHVRFGPPVEEILRFAAAGATDLIVMATHGRSGVRRWIVGSVTEEVLSTATVPLLIRRSFDAAPRACPGAIRRILVPLDGSDAAEAVVPFVADLARAFGAEVTLAGAAESSVECVRYRFEHDSVHARAVVPQAIELLVAREHPDLVAVGTRARTGLWRRVLQHLPTPMFVYRAPSTAPAETRSARSPA